MAKTNAALVQKWRELGPITWAEGPHGWITEDGNSITLLPWQRAILAAWWTLRDDITTLALSNIKKTGKTLANALLLAWRWLALPGLHFAAGNDLDQSAGRQFQEVAAMVKRNAYLNANSKIEKSRIVFLPTESEIVALPVDATGNAGANHISSSHTEAWGVIYELAQRAYEELTSPPGLRYGLPALRVVDSYAGYEGESETWHKLVDAGLGGEPVSDWPIYRAGGILLFHMEGEEAQARCFRGTPEQAARYYADQKAQLRPMAYQRLHLNQRTAGAEALITADEWDSIVDETLAPLPPNKSAPVFIGLDIGVKHDHCAVVAVAPHGADMARLAFLEIFKPTKATKVSLTEVADYLRYVHRNYWLAGIFFDPSQALFLTEQLSGEGLIFQEVPQSLPVLGPRGRRLYDAIKNKRLIVYPSEELRAAALAAQAKEISSGLHITKANKSRKVDAIVALSFALPAALEGGPTEPGTIARLNPSTPSVFSHQFFGTSRFGRGDDRRSWHNRH